MVRHHLTLVIAFAVSAALVAGNTIANEDSDSSVRDAALDLLESLTRLMNAGWRQTRQAHFYGAATNASGLATAIGSTRQCRSSERQVTTVDGNSAQVCCIGQEKTNCRRLACAQVVDHCCQTSPGQRNMLCTGVVGAQRLSLPASCQQRGQQTRIIINEQESKVRVRRA